MRDGQHIVSAAQAQALITRQMPDLALLPLRRTGISGTDNVLFRLGPDLVARFPRFLAAEAQISTQSQWVARVCAPLPLAAPLTERLGLPGETYPFRWSVLRWLPGHAAFAGRLDQAAAATALAEFLTTLRAQPQPDGAPLRGDADRLALRFASLGPHVGQFRGEADPVVLARIAAAMRLLPAHDGPLVWVHGDLHPLNLLARGGHLTGVIDWGGMGLGDPATDLLIAWTLFDTPAREAFRAALNPSPEAWARGRALAFAKAVAAIPFYRRRNPGFRAVMLKTLDRVLDDCARSP